MSPKTLASPKTITLPVKTYIVIRNAAFRTNDLIDDNKYYRAKVEKLENDIRLLIGSNTELRTQNEDFAEMKALHEQNELELKRQIHRADKPKRFSISMFSGYVVSKGASLHPAAGVGFTFNLFSFGKF